MQMRIMRAGDFVLRFVVLNDREAWHLNTLLAVLLGTDVAEGFDELAPGRAERLGAPREEIFTINGIHFTTNFGFIEMMSAAETSAGRILRRWWVDEVMPAWRRGELPGQSEPPDLSKTPLAWMHQPPVAEFSPRRDRDE